MKRRQFISNGLIYSSAIYSLGMVGCNRLKMQNNSQVFFKLSLAQWSLHKSINENGMNPFLFAQKAKEWGFEGIEYVNHLYNAFLVKYENQLEGIKAFVKASNSKSNEFKIANLLIMVDGEGDLALKDVKERNLSIENHKKWIDAASGLGCHSIRVNLFGSLKPEIWKDVSQESLLKLSEYAKKVDINILVENHGYLSSNAKLLTEVIQNVNQDNCGTLPDFGNFCLRREGNERWGKTCLEEYDKYKGVGELMKYAKAVSAKSYDFNQDGEETSIDYHRMLKILKENQYSGFIGVEYEGNNLTEQEGILATKELLIKSCNNI